MTTSKDYMTSPSELPEAIAYCQELWPSAAVTSRDYDSGWVIEVAWFSSPFKISLWISDNDAFTELNCDHGGSHVACIATSGRGEKRSWRNAVDVIVFKIGAMVAPVVSCLKI